MPLMFAVMSICAVLASVDCLSETRTDSAGVLAALAARRFWFVAGPSVLLHAPKNSSARDAPPLSGAALDGALAGA
jgi:hypothetical protein